jgi:single-stranded-DNA-specific exonuclease
LKKKWNILPSDKKAASLLKEELQINETICTLLVQRGIFTYDDAKKFFRPNLKDLHSPWLMKDMDKAVFRIKTAVNQNEKILILGDYDVDGTTAVASLYQFLTGIHDIHNLDFYIPNRYKEGYGVSKGAIDFAAKNNFNLIICVDCGIKSAELIDYAQSLGIDVIICDHHLPDAQLPKAVAILNPKQNDCAYPYKELCGCGIGFKLMAALAESFSLAEESYLRYLDLVAIAIAADIVPMNGENRILTHFGLQQINTEPSLGVKSLMQLSSLKYPLTINNVVFALAPRINAAGRMDDARKAVELFIEKDETKALQLAEILHNDNSERKDTDKITTEEALEMISLDYDFKHRKTTVVYKEDWMKGVVGIVASRLIENHYRPTVVLTKSGDLATGSARSIKGFNLYEAISECKEHLVAFGGHYAAAGLSLLPENIKLFSKKFDEVVSRSLSDDMLFPETGIDAKVSFSNITDSFYRIICQMEPFGPENMRPVFIASNVTETGHSKIVKEKHIKFTLKQNNKTLSGIGYNMSSQFHLLSQNKPIDIVFQIEENEYRGVKSLQLKIIDFRLSD